MLFRSIWTPANVEYYYYLSDKCGSALEDYLKCYSKNINVKNCSNYDYEDENEVCLTEMLLVEVHCDDDDDFDDDSCTDGEKKCADTTFMWCTSGIWITQDCEDSGKVCNETKGCVSADLDNL